MRTQHACIGQWTWHMDIRDGIGMKIASYRSDLGYSSLEGLYSQASRLSRIFLGGSWIHLTHVRSCVTRSGSYATAMDLRPGSEGFLVVLARL